MKTEKEIKDRIKELKNEEKKLAKDEIKFIEEKNEWEGGKVTLRLNGIFQELCFLKWVLTKSKISLSTITHNDIIKRMGTINVMEDGRIKQIKVKK